MGVRYALDISLQQQPRLQRRESEKKNNKELTLAINLSYFTLHFITVWSGFPSMVAWLTALDNVKCKTWRLMQNIHMHVNASFTAKLVNVHINPNSQMRLAVSHTVRDTILYLMHCTFSIEFAVKTFLSMQNYSQNEWLVYFNWSWYYHTLIHTAAILVADAIVVNRSVL